MNLNMQIHDVTDQQLMDYSFMKALAICGKHFHGKGFTNPKVTPILPTAIVSHFAS